MTTSTRKMGIRKRFLIWMFSAALLSFAVLSAVLLLNMYRIQDNAVERGRDVGQAAGRFTEALAENHAKQKLLIDVTENAHHANRELSDIVENVTCIALSMEKILSKPESNLPRILKEAGRETVHSGECYILYGPKTRRPDAWGDILQESRIAANIADILEELNIYYSGYDISCFFASQNGYLIAAESFPGEDLPISEDVARNYDPTERAFYKEVLKKGALVNQTYTDTSGYQGILCAMPCYVGGEMAGVAGIGIGMASLYHDITEKSVGASGINFALNENGEVVFSSEQEGTLAISMRKADLRATENEALAQAAVEMTEGKSGVVPLTLDGEEYYLAYAPMPTLNWSFASLARKDEVVNGVQVAKEDVLGLSRELTDSIHGFFVGSFRQMAFSMVVIFAVVSFLSRVAANQMVRPILTLTGGVEEIAKGNLDVKLDIRTGEELEELSSSINQMSGELKLYIENLAEITVEKERIQTELNLAQGIQEGMLPSIFPKFVGNPHYDLFASMDTAREVGGDFYDFYHLDDEHLAMTVADVSGKGIPASLFMVISKTILKNEAIAAANADGAASVDWGKVMERVNCQLCENNEEMMFVTVFFGVLNIRTGEFAYVNGGHNAPLLGNMKGDAADWRYIHDGKKSHMVGVVENASYEEKRLRLLPGDMLYFYTDGVTEAMDEERKLYSEERLQAALNRMGTPTVSSKELLESIRKDITLHVGGAEQSDDITMLGIRYLK